VLLAGGYIYLRRDPTLGTVVLLSAVIYPFYYAVELWQPALEGKQEFSKRSLYEGGTTVVRLALTILVVIVTNGDPVYVFVTFVGTQLLPNAIYAGKALATVDNDTVESGWKASSLRLSLVNVLYTLYDHVDKVALAFFLTSSELAIYSVAVAIGNAIRRATDSVLRIYYPSIFQSENKDILRDIKRALPLTTLMVGGLVVVAVMALPTVIELLYTDKYAESIFYAQLYLGVIPLYVAVSIASTVLIKNQIENLYTAAVAVASVVNVGLYVILIPEYGIIGGILGSFGYFIVQLILELGILYWKS
jgi:O-antigen/teichoic acid export membrane protein